MKIENGPERSSTSQGADDAIASWVTRRDAAIKAQEIEPARANENPMAPKLRMLARERDLANRAQGYFPSRNRGAYYTGQLERSRRADATRTRLTTFLGAVGIAGATALAPAMTDANYGAEKATEFLEQSGYSDVEHTDTDQFFLASRGCGRGDAVMYEFDATAPNGSDVEMLVCKGLFKGATLRQG